jgi:hypothetical protein
MWNASAGKSRDTGRGKNDTGRKNDNRVDDVINGQCASRYAIEFGPIFGRRSEFGLLCYKLRYRRRSEPRLPFEYCLLSEKANRHDHQDGSRGRRYR